MHQMHLFGVLRYMQHTSRFVIVGNLCARHDDLWDVLPSLAFLKHSHVKDTGLGGSWLILLFTS